MPSCISSHLSDTFKSNNTKMLSSKSFICIFKATESPFNMVLLRDTSIPGQQLRVHPSQTPVSKQGWQQLHLSWHKLTFPTPQTDLGVCVPAWMSMKHGIRISFPFMNHLSIPGTLLPPKHKELVFRLIPIRSPFRASHCYMTIKKNSIWAHRQLFRDFSHTGLHCRENWAEQCHQCWAATEFNQILSKKPPSLGLGHAW